MVLDARELTWLVRDRPLTSAGGAEIGALLCGLDVGIAMVKFLQFGGGGSGRLEEVAGGVRDQEMRFGCWFDGRLGVCWSPLTAFPRAVSRAAVAVA